MIPVPTGSGSVPGVSLPAPAAVAHPSCSLGLPAGSSCRQWGCTVLAVGTMGIVNRKSCSSSWKNAVFNEIHSTPSEYIEGPDLQ